MDGIALETDSKTPIHSPAYLLQATDAGVTTWVPKEATTMGNVLSTESGTSRTAPQ